MIEKIDIFGISPSLYFQGKAHYQTKCGSILTLLTGVAIVFSFIFYGREMFFKENPQTVFSEEFTRQPEVYSFEKSKNSIAFGLQNFAMPEEYPNYHFIDESIYTMKFTMNKRTKILNQDTGKEEIDHKQHEIPLRPCIDSDFQVQGTEKSFKSLPFKNQLFCIDNYDSQPIEIEGDFGEEVFSVLYIQAYQCRNSTENGNSCKSQEEIDRHLDSQYWAMYFSDQLINPKNYTHPFQFIDRDLFSVSSNKEYNEYQLKFQNMYVESDTGLLWSSKEQKRGLKLSSEAHQTYKKPKENGEFLKIEFRYEKFKQQRIFRSYVNLGEVIAQVGGLSKMVLMTFWLFSYLFVQRDYTIKVLNKLYNFNQEKPILEKKERDDFTNKEKEIQSQIQLQNISLDLSQAYQIDESYKDRLLSFFKKMFARLKISSFQSYFYHIYNQDVKINQKLLKQATQKLYSNLDVVRILTKLQEVDKLKELLLNTEQKQLFEYIPKPLIKDDKENSGKDSLYDRIYNEDEEEFEKIQSAFRAYKKIQARNSKSKVDYKIMDLLDRKVRTYFDQIYKQNENKSYKTSNNNKYHNVNRTQEVSCNSSLQKLSSGSDDKNLDIKDTTDINILASNIVTKNVYNKGNITSEDNQVIEIDDKENKQTLIKLKQMIIQMNKQIQILMYDLNELKLKYIQNNNNFQKQNSIKSIIDNNDEIDNEVIRLEQLDIDIPVNSTTVQAQYSNASRNKNNNSNKTNIRDKYKTKLVLQQAQSFNNLNDLQYKSQTNRNSSDILQTPKGDNNFLIYQQ